MIDPFVLRWCRAVLQFTMISNVDRLPLRAFHAPLEIAAVKQHRHQPEHGLVVIAHGAGEHAARYARLTGELNRAGFAVLSMDHRGHGHSPGPGGLGDFGRAGWDGLVADLGQLIGWGHALHPNAPLTLLGHSMGAAAAQHLCLTGSTQISALVLSGSTSMRQRQQRELAAVARGEAPTVGLARTGFENRTAFDWLSRDAAEVDKYIADPWCGFSFSDTVRASMITRMALSDDAQLANIRPDLPVLLLAGDADPINDELRGLHALASEWRAAGVRRIDTQFYSGGRHEMFNEINRDEVTANMIEWITGLDS